MLFFGRDRSKDEFSAKGAWKKIAWGLPIIALLAIHMNLLGFHDKFSWFMLAFWFIALQFFPWAYRIVFALNALALCMYHPVGIIYGAPSVETTGYLFGQKNADFIGFFDYFDFSMFLQVLFWLAIYVLCTIYLVPKAMFAPNNKGKLVAFASIVFLALEIGYLRAGFADFGNYLKTSFNVPFVGIVDSLKKSATEWQGLKSFYKDSSENTSSWLIEAGVPKYKTFVLVVAGAEAKSAFGAYGNKLDTSPFLSKTNGVVMNGIYAAGNTLKSGVFTALADNQVETWNNVISLANKAGIQTFWISSYGILGSDVAQETAMALRSDKSYFAYISPFSKKLSRDDNSILPLFDKALGEFDHDKSRLVVVRLMGDEPGYCMRHPDKTIRSVNRDMSCYLGMVRKTDHIVKSIVEKLKKSNESYSLIFTSDRGMVLKNVGQKNEKFEPNTWTNLSKVGYEVPFFKISSDDDKRIVDPTNKTMMGLVNAMAVWMNIKLTDRREYNFFDNSNDNNLLAVDFSDENGMVLFPLSSVDVIRKSRDQKITLDK